MNADQLAGITHELAFRRLRRRSPRRKVSLSSHPLISVICASQRPHQLEHVLEQYHCQEGVRKELILLTNAANYAGPATQRCDAMDDVTVVETNPNESLGHVLNRGAALAAGEAVAKFDDDDWYGPTYLATASECMVGTNAAVLGKKTYLAYFEAADETTKLFPGNENQRVGRVAGGTIVAHQDVFERVTFADVTLGEDVRFVRAAERCGFGVFSTAATGYLQLRSTDHTWNIADKKLAADGVLVGPGRRREYWM